MVISHMYGKHMVIKYLKDSKFEIINYYVEVSVFDCYTYS